VCWKLIARETKEMGHVQGEIMRNSRWGITVSFRRWFWAIVSERESILMTNEWIVSVCAYSSRRATQDLLNSFWRLIRCRTLPQNIDQITRFGCCVIELTTSKSSLGSCIRKWDLSWDAFIVIVANQDISFFIHCESWIVSRKKVGSSMIFLKRHFISHHNLTSLHDSWHAIWHFLTFPKSYHISPSALVPIVNDSAPFHGRVAWPNSQIPRFWEPSFLNVDRPTLKIPRFWEANFLNVARCRTTILQTWATGVPHFSTR
jgi:hypothetical protein